LATNRTVVVVQARVGSSRLPGKVLMDLNGRTVLEEVLLRCRAIQGVDEVVCAIPEGDADRVLAPPAESAGARVVSGSATDVLSRYLKAAEISHAEVVMRVTSDCPLIDPALCGEVLAARSESGVDYSSNNQPRLFPHGLDCEAFTMSALRQAAQSATDAYDREHVTPWLRNNPAVSRVAVKGPGGAAASHRWTLDYIEDYEFLRGVFERIPAGCTDWRIVRTIVEKCPELSAINRMHAAR